MKKATVAVAHRILVIVYSMIRSGEAYREQGPDYFDRLHPERTKNRLTARLDRLDFWFMWNPNFRRNRLNC
jgi:transposase